MQTQTHVNIVSTNYSGTPMEKINCQITEGKTNDQFWPSIHINVKGHIETSKSEEP
uniref:Uncharacterized protein n=1 Tax=Rhizophora mucronata TaxID=61149 RepID=A0A2P2Q6L6_RHIMU